AAEAADACVPSCVGKDPGSYVPDPHDCHKYYGCRENGNVSDVAFSCPDGYYFDSYYSKCSTEYNPCKATCPLPGCSLTCHEDSDLLLFPGDCGKYRVCGPEGTTTTNSCPPLRPYFDGQVCQTDVELCCDACEVRCNYVGTEILDPYNCTNYYFCQSFYSTLHGSCGSDAHFDPIIEKCVAGSECQNVCTL
ncbi:Chitin binding domain, partial [Trinorchestia longiramus]